MDLCVGVEDKPRVPRLEAALEKPLVLLLLALDAVTGPGNSLQALLLDLLLAGYTKAIGPGLHAFERFVDKLQEPPIFVALVEEELLCVGIGSLIRNVLCRFFVSLPAVLFRLDYQAKQLFLLGLEALLVKLNFLPVHDQPYFFSEVLTKLSF
jgi:hypothetical protein